MNEYHKINTVWKREAEKPRRIIPGSFSTPEFEYLSRVQWTFTEKVDGTNIRVMKKNGTVRFGGKSDNAQIPSALISRLQELFPDWKMDEVFPETDTCLYGEGYGAKIQKGGGNYCSSPDFVLFDVRINGIWLERESVAEVARQLGIRAVPCIGSGTLLDACELAATGFDSAWGPFAAEGIVMRPERELFNRLGSRIIAKIKHRDYSSVVPQK